jgi:peptide/nickel transport system substrate-binding protein
MRDEPSAWSVLRTPTSRRRLLRGGAAAGLGVAGAWLLACGGGKDTGKSRGVEERFAQAGVASTATIGGGKIERSIGKRGGRVVGAIGEPDSFDPHRDAGFPGVQVVNGVYSTLWRGSIPPGQSPIIEGDLVQSHEQPDNLTLIMKFPATIRWQNVAPVFGREFTSDDVKVNFERMATDQPGYGLAPFLNMIKSVETPDKQTAVVKFSFPYAPFILNMADGWPVVIPRELYKGDDAKTTAVGTGPFIIRRRERGVGVFVDRNPDYFKKDAAGNQLPYLDGIDWVIFPDASTSLSAFITKKLDIRGVSITDEPKVRDAVPDVQMQESIGAPFLMDINVEFPLFRDKRVREALKYATDYDLVIKIGYLGLAIRGQPLSNSMRGFTLDKAELPQRDVAKAKQLLAAAGYPNGIEIENWIPNNYNPDTGHTQIQQGLKEAGIEMKFRITDWTPWRTGGYGIEPANPPLQVTSTAIFVFLNPDRQLWIDYHTGAANNNSRYSNKEFDKLLDDARKEFDQARQQQIYKNAARMLIDDTPSVFIAESLARTFYHKHLKNWGPDDGSTNFLHWKKFDYVWLDGAPSR